MNLLLEQPGGTGAPELDSAESGRVTDTVGVRTGTGGHDTANDVSVAALSTHADGAAEAGYPLVRATATVVADVSGRRVEQDRSQSGHSKSPSP
ncbi:hypothetical protein ACFWPQ_15900 [Streptomyces sp. NPDC058464]|uniref:hypothetical protein n=1 Tax=Streptomyces sp. NPDC058464 TaxID=3346511 RepID=UPI00365E148F